MEEMALKENKIFSIYAEHSYFVTGRCDRGFKYLEEAEIKEVFKIFIKDVSLRYNVCVNAWVVLHNHYHILFSFPHEDNNDNLNFILATKLENSLKKIKQVEYLNKFVTKLETNIAKKINEKDKKLSRKVWQKHWVHTVKNETDFWTHFNYILKNSLKHRLVPTMGDAYEYEFSSNPVWLERWGVEGLSYCSTQYPASRCKPEDEK